MTPADAEWAAALMDARRRIYVTYSPVFWRPAADPVPGHAAFLADQIEGDALALRTDGGFLVGQVRGEGAVVDDFAVAAPALWPTHGRALLEAALAQLHARGAAEVLVVAAQRDLPKSALLREVGLRLVEQWWVKELRPGTDDPRTGPREGNGFSGILGPAPPVYDPGGPVFLAHRVDEGTAASTVATAAAEWGAVLAVVPAAPRSGLSEELTEAGFEVASDWYSSRRPTAAG